MNSQYQDYMLIYNKEDSTEQRQVANFGINEDDDSKSIN